ALTDKFITSEDAERIWRELSMTKVEKLILEERANALMENTRTVTQSVSSQIASNLLNSGCSVEMVAENTGLSIEEVERLKAKAERPIIE
ncbi:MAG: hypothetical protein K5989_12440, partial [Lachnospiraceae bacterium]|nr:hypothetical protein [Lachnospiraceae bacterium]